ncbi:F-type H+-transporting ATPase subunit delta [Monoraphidium neglectum]|uniref:F-type H+-transporting ATPase subunit delta n=1 Tax=Monoraphidium neglectum TaxID=145388 RepID=A0A0D2MAM8_9CHLO|nr:F-type H+-transporting ATPase subunit delta [Monoraphidium neglectum]KIY92405.1 F-type H+-transporting ATPase subunit delta [Monoraphidium neglectum]|eukprot:XP_013891425.1 F-type H+-transporting ATPase subunit delta [Monoraphidium neglectum]
MAASMRSSVVSRSAFRAAQPAARRAVLMAAKRNDVSDSYAKALVELAEEKGKLEQVHADVDAVASLIKENKKLTDLLYNPVVDGDKKKAVLAKIAKEAGFQGYTGNFLNVLVQKDRLNLLPEIVESFEEQYCELTDTQAAPSSCARRPLVRRRHQQQQQQQLFRARVST